MTSTNNFQPSLPKGQQETFPTVTKKTPPQNLEPPPSIYLPLSPHQYLERCHLKKTQEFSNPNNLDTKFKGSNLFSSKAAK